MGRLYQSPNQGMGRGEGVGLMRYPATAYSRWRISACQATRAMVGSAGLEPATSCV